SALYYTNINPTSSGLTGLTVQGSGVQTIQVVPQHPLVLLNLTVSLEWDARNDQRFNGQLKYDLQRTSELLFDWSSGQVALGTITIYQARDHWNDAHIRIYASNRIRPHSTIGGISDLYFTDPISTSLVYGPGEISMGAVWNRFGTSN